MKKRQLTLWVSMLLVAMVVLSACAPRPGAGMTAAGAAGDDMDLVVDLPAIVVDIDSAGMPSIGNVPIGQMGAMLGAGGALDALQVDPEWVTYLTASNIQHLQVNNRPDGLLLLVNGEPIPSLAWDGESLSTTASTVAALGVAVPTLEKVLPLITKLGLGAIIRFPVASGNALIPEYIEGNGTAAAEAAAAQASFLAGVGEAPTLNLPVFYAADGSWTVGDLSDSEWTALTGAPWSVARLNPALIEGLVNANIKQLSISTDTAGVHISINGKALPYLTWGNGEINHLLDLAGQLGLWDMLAPGTNVGEIIGTVESLLPVIQVADANITVFFPDESMAVR